DSAVSPARSKRTSTGIVTPERQPAYSVTRRTTLSRSLFRSRGHDILYGALPAVGGDIENDAFGRPVLHLVEHVRILLPPPGQVGAAGGLDLAVGLLRIIDPHAEMNDPFVAFLCFETRHRLVLEVQKRHIHGAVSQVDAAHRAPGPRHSERLLEESRGLLG